MPSWGGRGDVDAPSWERRASAWIDDDEGGPSDTAAERFEQQLRAYEREKLACRLKVCCCLQLLASVWFAFAPPLRSGRFFGLLCAASAVVGFLAAQGSQRSTMRAACALSVSVMVAGLGFLYHLALSLVSYSGNVHVSTQRLLWTFTVLSSTVVLSQICTLRLCLSLLCLSHARGGRAHESLGFFLHEEVYELLHIDLARTPPTLEAREPASSDDHREYAARLRERRSPSASESEEFKLT